MEKKVYCLCYQDDYNAVPEFFAPIMVFSSLEKAKNWIKGKVDTANKNTSFPPHKYKEFSPYDGAVCVATDGFYTYGIFEYKVDEETEN